MATMRATFFFTDDNGYGWTETYFNNAGDLPTTMTRARALLPLRIKCLGLTSGPSMIRVSDDEVKRDSQIYIIASGDNRNKDPDAGPSDIANTCLVVRIEAGPTIRRTLYMRGIPDGIVLNSGVYSPTPDFGTAFTRFANALGQNGWSIKSLGIVNPVLTNTNIVQPALGQEIRITTLGAHGLAINDTVVIRGVRGASYLAGQHRVFAKIDDTNYSILSNRVLPELFNYGTTQKYSFRLTGISNAQVIRASHRIAGRPFSAPRGRRRAQTRI